MSSTMGSYMIAQSGVHSSQSALQVTTNNITNVDTTGYSRQIVYSEQIVLNSGIGTGAQVQDIVQIRDKYVDEKYRSELAGYSSENASYLYTYEIERALNAVVGDGLEKVIDPFFNAWEDLAVSPDDASVRAVLIETAASLTEAFNTTSDKLMEIQEGMNSNIESAVDRINELTKSIAAMNRRIVAEKAEGETPTDLLDAQNVLLDELCAYTGCSYFEANDGSTTVYLDNAILVNGSDSNSLSYSVEGVSQIPSVIWTDSNKEAEFNSGALNGLLSVGGRGGTLSEAMAQLDDLVASIAEMINDVHATGKGLNGTTGVDFFVLEDGAVEMTASTIRVNEKLDDTDLIAASSSGASGANDIALEIAALRDTAGVADACEEIIDWIASINSLAKSSLETSELLVEQMESKRSTIMDVDLDEELSNLIVYQQAYNANAQVLQVMDEIVEMLINNM